MGAKYFQRALWLPVIVPVATFLSYGYLDLILGETRTAESIRDALGAVATFLGASLVFGGLQYLFCLAWARKRLSNVNVDEAIRFWWKFPLVFFGVEFVTLEVIAIPLGASLGRWDSFFSGVTGAAAISALALPLGYMYSAIVIGGYYLAQWWLRRFGRSTRQSAEKH